MITPRLLVINLFVATALAVERITWADVGSNVECNGAGEVYLGKSSSKVSDIAACKKSCEDGAGCQSITFYDGGWCSHFSTGCKKTKSVNKAISKISVAIQLAWADVGSNVECNGAGGVYLSKSSSKVSDIAACKKSCADGAGCQSITFYDGGWCSHFSTGCKKTKSVNKAISKISVAIQLAWADVGSNVECNGAGGVYLSKSSSKVSDIAACKKSCADGAGCQSITFYDGGWCSHFSTGCKKTKPVNKAVSMMLFVDKCKELKQVECEKHIEPMCSWDSGKCMTWFRKKWDNRVCKANEWIPSVDGKFNDIEKWVTKKVPTATDVVMVQDAGVEISKTTAIGDLTLNKGSIIFDGTASLVISGNVECSGGEGCPAIGKVKIGSLVKGNKLEMCHGKKEGSVCKASEWIPSVDGEFNDIEKWVSKKVPTATDVVMVQDAGVEISKTTAIGHLALNEGSIIFDGTASLAISGNVECSGEGCPAPDKVKIGSLVNQVYYSNFLGDQLEMCPGKEEGPACKASEWGRRSNNRYDGIFHSDKHWVSKKAPTATDVAVVEDATVLFLKPITIGHLSMSDRSDIIFEGGQSSMVISGKLDCSDGSCPAPVNARKGSLFDLAQDKICVGTDTTTTTVTTTTTTITTTTSTTSTSTTTTSTSTSTSTTTPPVGVQCEKVNSKKFDLKSFSTKDGAEIQSGSGKSQWIHLKRGCTMKTTGSATVIFDTIPGETYQLEFEASVSKHNADNKKDDFSTGHVQLNGLDDKFHTYKVFSTFNSKKTKNEKWDPILVHFRATGKKTTVLFTEEPRNCISFRNVVLGQCKSIEGKKCSKTCQHQTCDYWGKEEDFSCVTLEKDYGCNCDGCTCSRDTEICEKEKCLGKTCDVWVSKYGVSCDVLRNNYKCKCTGCQCEDVKVSRGSTSTTTTTTTTTDLRETTTSTTSTSTTSTTIPGCTNKVACNYNKAAKTDDGSCTFPKKGYNCKKECLAKFDKCGVCGGQGIGGDKTKCSASSFRADNYCDHGNNNCGCGWDGGDCCGNKHKNQYKYCGKKCQCKDPSYTAPAPSKCKKECGKHGWKGDNNCDDVNNFCGCDWDGGDCCGAKKNYKYCKTCKCLDPAFKAPAPSSDGCSKKIKSCKKACAKPGYKGDGYCDDTNNHCGCAWDGGDCCGKKNFKFCKDCLCLDCKYVPKGDACVTAILGMCKKPLWKGDGNCDDDNNIAGCAWDGGDCCGVKNFKYCKVCKCLDCTFEYKSDKCTKNIKKGCGAISYKGDKFCDDNNNNAGCQWDGGDCCGPVNTYKYCKQCKCLDCTYKTPTDKCTTKIKGKCEKPNWKGDKNCDDMNNNAGCNWDGGDCCGDKNNYGYCKKCQCRDCTYKGAGDECVKVIKKGCEKPKYKGDGFCDDANNRAGCAWDGGDCCGSKRNVKYCKKCACLDCTAKGDGCMKQGKIKGSCAKPVWKGDKTCDDENNNAGCGWDGGDCCGEGNNYKLCKQCKCKDCNFKKCPGKKTCQKPVWKGDGNCDDVNNACGCNWDGGDCCGKTVVKKFCKECKCLNPDKAGGKCLGKCAKPAYTGDTFCDDNNNNCGCGWDAGDCCGVVKKKYCKACKCLDPKNNKK